MLASKSVISKTEHRKDTGYRQGAVCRAMHFFIKRGPDACRLHPVGARSGPVQLVEGRLATSNFKYIPGIVWVRCVRDHKCRRSEIPLKFENPRQAAGFEDRTRPAGFVKAP